MDEYVSSPPAGILYAEDFGSPAPAPRTPKSSPPLTRDDVDNACIRAVQSAQNAWADHAAERRTASLEAVAAGLAEARRAAETQAESVAEGIAQVALGMVSSVLPHLCRNHGDAEVRALMRQILPLLAPSTPVVVRVHAGLIEALQADLATMPDELAANLELRPANLAAGDARLSWADGHMVRDTAAICAAVQQGLAQLGLDTPPVEHAVNKDRSLAFAE